ncbi:MAG: RidA family protein [Bdellovibrionales bacterium]|jgi:2-iminobutanoate/2-iminopropanoate deaminase|nr:RidA family protein [Bdellovibrionales bacterium]
MATTRIHESKSAPAPIGPYSQAVEVNGFVYCSGQIPLDPASGEIVGKSVGEQTEQVMANIKAVLTAADLTLASVVKTTIFLTDMADFQGVNEVYSKHMGATKPARSTVAVAGLPRGVKVEIEVLAAR